MGICDRDYYERDSVTHLLATRKRARSPQPLHPLELSSTRQETHSWRPCSRFWIYARAGQFDSLERILSVVNPEMRSRYPQSCSTAPSAKAILWVIWYLSPKISALRIQSSVSVSSSDLKSPKTQEPVFLQNYKLWSENTSAVSGHVSVSTLSEHDPKHQWFQQRYQVT